MMQSKITSVTQINKNIEEGRLLYAAMSLLAKSHWRKRKPEQILKSVSAAADRLFPEIKALSILKCDDESILLYKSSLEIGPGSQTGIQP